MPSSRNIVVLAAMGLLLPLIFIPFSTSATPTISPDSQTYPTVSDPSPSSITRKEITDIAFSLLFFILFMGSFALIGGCFSIPPLGVAVDRIRVAYRTFVETLSRIRLGSLVRKAADAFIGTYNAWPPPRDGGGTSPSTQTTSPQSLEQLENQRPGAIAATHDASSAGVSYHRACPVSA